MVVPPIALVLEHVVAFIISGYARIALVLGANVLVLLWFSKINRMTGFLSYSLKMRLLMIINTIEVGCSPPVKVKKNIQDGHWMFQGRCSRSRC
jgi:hypothetical protein